MPGGMRTYNPILSQGGDFQRLAERARVVIRVAKFTKDAELTPGQVDNLVYTSFHLATLNKMMLSTMRIIRDSPQKVKEKTWDFLIFFTMGAHKYI